MGYLAPGSVEKIDIEHQSKRNMTTSNCRLKEKSVCLRFGKSSISLKMFCYTGFSSSLSAALKGIWNTIVVH
jgi:hypothetical protein